MLNRFGYYGVIIAWLFLLVSLSFAKSQGKVFYQKSGNQYIVFAVSNSGRVILNEAYPKEPIIKDCNNGIKEIGISFGSPNYYCRFVDLINQRASSRSFYNPVAIDLRQQYIAATDKKSIMIYRIFGNPKALKMIERNYSSAGVFSAVIKARFLSGRKLYLKYMEGKKFKEKEEIVRF